MFSILLVLLIIVAVLMTGLILLQKSEGSGMSGSSAASMFGGVLTGSAAGNFLTKMTAVLATIFFILCALLSLCALFPLSPLFGIDHKKWKKDLKSVRNLQCFLHFS